MGKTTYQEYGLNLSDRQKDKLATAFMNRSTVTLRLEKGNLSENHEVMLTKTQVNRIKRAISKGAGVELKISKTQARKVFKQGDSLWSSLLQIETKMLPFVTKGVGKVAAPLATEAVSALDSLDIDKLFGSGQEGGFLIPHSKVQLLIQKKSGG